MYRRIKEEIAGSLDVSPAVIMATLQIVDRHTPKMARHLLGNKKQCPVCFHIDMDTTNHNYCCNCGQRLL